MDMKNFLIVAASMLTSVLGTTAFAEDKSQVVQLAKVEIEPTDRINGLRRKRRGLLETGVYGARTRNLRRDRAAL